MPSSVLLFGASGHTGGPFLQAFTRQHPDNPVMFFLRSNDLDSALQSLDVTILKGDFSELSRITDLSFKHDVVINAATSMDLALTEAIVAGVKENKGTLIHMSDPGNDLDGGKTGKFPADGRKVWNDTDQEQMKSISAAMLPNGPCDEAILKAAAAEDFQAFFVSPGGVYGQSKDPLVANASTMGVSQGWMTRNITQHGFSPYIGKGTSVFHVVSGFLVFRYSSDTVLTRLTTVLPLQTVHVDDVVALLLLVYRKATSPETSKTEPASSHYYMGLGYQEEWKTIAQAFATFPHREGEFKDKYAKSVGFEEAGVLNA